MSDPIHNWLIDLGADSKHIHDLFARLRFICRHYNIPNNFHFGSKAILKKMFKPVRVAIERGESITRERFIVLSLSGLDSPKKWDLDHIGFCRSKKFYQSQTWKNLRFKALEKSNRCHACGRSPSEDVVLHVDHILPRSVYPEYAMTLANLQILCADCNMGKGNMHEKDFRVQNVGI